MDRAGYHNDIMPNFMVRGLPERLYELLKDAAETHQRSVNKEIIARLEASLVGRRLPPDEFLREMRELRSRQKREITTEEVEAAIRFGRS
jgi:antitoxin FitA